MQHLSSAAHLNAIVWITSLGSDERGATRRVIEDLEPYLHSIQVAFALVEPKSAKDLCETLDAVAVQAHDGLRPVIHFDTHGLANRGIYIAASGEYVDWHAVVTKLRVINVVTGNNLCVVSAACFSMQIIKFAQNQ
jgi:hypothetical protein